MRRAICLLTAAAMALQATGIAFASYTYDDAGRTETIDKFGETTTFEYDEASRPEKMIYDTGAYALYTYDGRSRIKAVEHKNSSNTLLRKETNTYDPASRITSRYEGPASGGTTTNFGYDDAGQLTSESSSGYSASYTYDANGNRTNRTVNGVSETYTVDDSDKLTSVTWSQGGNNYEKNYTYHYSGRPTSIVYETNNSVTATETMTWDKESRMLTNSLANASYVYNGFDARVSKTVSSTTTTFKRAGADPVSPVLSDVVGSTTTNYLPGISSRVGSTSTFSHSGIKNGILQTNSSQSNTATKRYDAFGDDPTTTGTWQTRFDYGGGFGYQRDDESGYKLLGHRYYDPEIGRFLTRDPIKDGRNWYAYCDGNPISGADPSGLYWFSRQHAEDFVEMLRGYGDVLWGISTPGMIANSPKLIQEVWSDPLAAPGKFARGFVESFTGFSSTDMRSSGRATMNWILVLAPAAKKVPGVGLECFVAGTKIVMADGSAKAIEDIRVGDKVLTRDQFGNGNDPATTGIVTKTFDRKTAEVLQITLASGHVIETTPEHPFFVMGKGFVPAEELTAGYKLVSAASATESITAVVKIRATRNVYNFEVAGTHTYFVGTGRGSAWVHNQCARPGAGSALPSKNGPKNGSLVSETEPGKGTIRDYGPDGRAKTDYDIGHHPELGPIHAHDWDWSKRRARGPARPLRPGE